nr:MAG TPA: hypothetical protein [Caudoviricetes sp.]
MLNEILFYRSFSYLLCCLIFETSISYHIFFSLSSIFETKNYFFLKQSCFFETDMI